MLSPARVRIVRLLVLVSGGRVETLQASPLIRTLAEALPDAEIILACPPGAADLAAHLYGVGEILALPSLTTHWNLRSWIGDWMRVRRRRVDIAILCSGSARVRLLAYAAGIAQRLGIAGGLTTVLLSDHQRDPGSENPAGLWLRLAHLLGVAMERHAPRLELGEGARQRALVQLHSSGVADGRLLVALAPGDGFSDEDWRGPRHRWGEERWAHLANQLAMRHAAGIVFIGTTSDEEIVKRSVVDTAATHANLAGTLGVIETAALVGLCDLLVSADSPLLHLAAGVGTPTVGLFGPTSGRRRGPYGVEHRMVQALARVSPSGSEPTSLQRIRVEDVLAAIETDGV